MLRTVPVALFLSACLSVAGFAQTRATTTAPTAAPTAAPDDKYRNEALVWERFDTVIHMHADGTGDRTIHVVVRLQSEGAARQFSVLSVPYASAYETGSIDYIRVHKPDGTTVETPVADAIEMPAAVTREAPLYSDLKEKQLPVRSVAAGDVLDYQLRTVRTRAEAPGQFWGSEHFLMEGGVVLSQTVTLEVPADKYVKVWDPNHPAKPTEHNGLLTYQWSSSQLDPTPKPKDPADKNPAPEKKDPDEDADGRKLPSMGWTTFHSWAEVGDWYRALAQGRSTPTPTIQARADQLTRDAKTPEDQLRALYAYVSKTRYVGIDFGVGRYQPHTADEVMDHEYGDCKDKDTLLEALAHAKGFTTAPALIGVSIAPVADLPSPASFNHVITTVQLPANGKSGGQIWLDTTPEVLPFRLLIPQIRDEQALVIPDHAPASLERTPADPPFPFVEQFNATGTLDKDGLLKSHMELTMRSDNELGFRLMLQRVAPAQWDQAMQYVSQAMSFGGTVTGTDFKQSDPAGPVHIAYDYSRTSYADWDHLRILPLFPVLEITLVDKDKAPDHDIDQGTPRTLEATTHLQLPDGYRAELPDAVHVKRDYATFDKTYRMDKSELICERKVVILKKKVPKADWKDYAAYLKSTGVEEGENYISLFSSGPAPKPASLAPGTADPKIGNKTAIAVVPPKPPAENDPSAATSTPPEAGKSADAAQQSRLDLMFKADAAHDAMLDAMMKSARKLELDDNWAGAQAMLEEVRSKDPYHFFLMSMLGVIAAHDGKLDEAISDYEAELARHPQHPSNVLVLLANAYVSQKRYAEAETLIRKYLSRNDSVLFVALANAQTRSGNDAEAVVTLSRASVNHPNDGSIELPLALALHRLHRDREAAAVAKTVTIVSEDPRQVNGAAYALSEMKLELPSAEKGSRRVIDALEANSLKGTLQNANLRTFAQTDLLMASWDTLGWILFQEGNTADSEAYVRASWQGRFDIVVGNHLAQILEKSGKSAEALDVERMALVASNAALEPEASADVKRSLAKLERAGIRGEVADPAKALQQMNTFQVPDLGDINSDATARILVNDQGVEDSRLESGPSQMQAISADLTKLKLPGLLPPASRAHLFLKGSLKCSAGSSSCMVKIFDPLQSESIGAGSISPSPRPGNVTEP